VKVSLGDALDELIAEVVEGAAVAFEFPPEIPGVAREVPAEAVVGALCVGGAVIVEYDVDEAVKGRIV
jgi:hypothetical protein